VLDCDDWVFVPGSVECTLAGVDATGCVCTDGSCGSLGEMNGDKDLTAGTCPIGSIGLGECLTCTFDVMTPNLVDGNFFGDDMCTNMVTVQGQSELCFPDDTGGCPVRDDTASVDVVIPRIDCGKTACADLNTDGVCDVGTLGVDSNFLNFQQGMMDPYPLDLIYEFTATNTGETMLEDGKICDQDFFADIATVGLISTCSVEETDGCLEIDDLDVNSTATVTCTVEFPSQVAFDSLAIRDTDNESKCYRNTAQALANIPDLTDVCTSGLDTTSSGECTMQVCGEPPPVLCCEPRTDGLGSVWNQNEVKFAGAQRCICSWDQTLLSRYTEGHIGNPLGGGVANHFLQMNLGTDRGKARVAGRASPLCDTQGFINPTEVVPSIDAPLLGLKQQILMYGNNVVRTGSTLTTVGNMDGQILYDTTGVPPEGPSTGPPALSDNGRVTSTQKGSLLAFLKVEVKWDASGQLIQDTFIQLSNDGSGAPVAVKSYIVDGEGCFAADNVFTLTQNQPAQFSIFEGVGSTVGNSVGLNFPVNISRLSSIAEPTADPDPNNPGGTHIHGYFICWAVELATEAEIRFNHLTGEATIVNYKEGTAWSYNAWAFQAVAGQQDRDLLLEPFGQLDLGMVPPERTAQEYDFAPAKLMFDFYASGSQIAFSGGNLPTVSIDSDLVLWAAIKDLRAVSLP